MNKALIHYLYWIIVTISFLLVAGCSSPPQPSGSVITENSPKNAQMMQQGPHKESLGQRQYYFACDSTSLPNHYRQSLKEQASYLKDHGDQAVTLYGYDATGGSPSTHLLRSYHRLTDVRQILLDDGVEDSQITIKPQGSFRAAPYKGHKNQDECRVDLIYTN